MTFLNFKGQVVIKSLIWDAEKQSILVKTSSQYLQKSEL